MTTARNVWTDILTADQMEANYQLTESLDPSFARQQREFYESRTEAQLEAMAAGAWYANDGDTYQNARSYISLRFGRTYFA